MELIPYRSPASLPFTLPALWGTLHAQGLRRFSRGLLATGLFEDLRSGDPFTLFAPLDPAFDSLPFPFDDLLLGPALVEARHDIFEYLTVRGHVAFPVASSRGAYPTLQGELVRLAPGLALGRFGASRILHTFQTGPLVVHVLEQCLFPLFPGSYLLENEDGLSS